MTFEQDLGGDERNADPSTSLPPDFLLRLVALAKFLRLSLKKAAYAAVVEGCVAGNPGSLRSG